MFYVLFKAEFEIGKGLFENLENSKSDLPNFWKFENWKSFQMNEPYIQEKCKLRKYFRKICNFEKKTIVDEVTKQLSFTYFVLIAMEPNL